MVLFLFTSCDEWLDANPDTVIDENDQFQTEAGFKEALSGIYIQMTSTSVYGKDMIWGAIDILSREYNPLPVNSYYKGLETGEYTDINTRPYIDAIWQKQYNIIANINSILLSIENGACPEISYNIIKGELLGLRAFIHLDLMRLFGVCPKTFQTETSRVTIPYVTGVSKDVTPQLTYAETIAKMKADIENAIKLLEYDPIYDVERTAEYDEFINNSDYFDYYRDYHMNYYAAKAVMARILMWEGGSENLQKASDLAQDVIDNSSFYLAPDWWNTKTEPRLDPEVMFNLDINNMDEDINKYLIATTNSTVDLLCFQESNVYEIFETEKPQTGLVDFRFADFMKSHSDGYSYVKLYQDQEMQYDYNTMPVMGLPEMYYIVIENCIDTDLAKAIELLNEVRTSRKIIEMIPSNSTAEVVKDELFKECRKEFINSGQLFFYYKRMGLEQLPAQVDDVTLTDNIYMLPYPDEEIQLGNRIQ